MGQGQFDEEASDISSDCENSDEDNYSSISEKKGKKKLTKHSMRVQDCDFMIQGL